MTDIIIRHTVILNGNNSVENVTGHANYSKLHLFIKVGNFQSVGGGNCGRNSHLLRKLLNFLEGKGL